MKRIKFIWDFRGPAALHTAKHHRIHLDDFCRMEALEHTETGFESKSEVHATAYLTAADSHLELIRDRLRPHRAVRV